MDKEKLATVGLYQHIVSLSSGYYYWMDRRTMQHGAEWMDMIFENTLKDPQPW